MLFNRWDNFKCHIKMHASRRDKGRVKFHPEAQNYYSRIHLLSNSPEYTQHAQDETVDWSSPLAQASYLANKMSDAPVQHQQSHSHIQALLAISSPCDIITTGPCFWPPPGQDWEFKNSSYQAFPTIVDSQKFIISLQFLRSPGRLHPSCSCPFDRSTASTKTRCSSQRRAYIRRL